MKQSLIRGSLISLCIRLLDLPCRYGFHLLIAIALGVTDTGRFYIVFSVMTALAGFGRLGVDQSLTRQLAMNLAAQQHQATRATIMRAIRHVLLASGSAAVLLAALANLIAVHILNKPDLALPLMLGALTLIPQNLGTVFAGALAGLHRVGLSQAIYSWLWPAIFCLITLPIALMGALTVNLTLLLIALSFSVAALTGAILLWRVLTNDAVPKRSEHPAASLLRPGLSLFTLDISKLLITTAPAIALGIYATEHETGLFALAWRIALIINLLISAVSAMAAPKFASYHALQNPQGMVNNAAQAIGLVLLIASPFIAAMLLFPETLLAGFGSGYGEGASTLRILAVGQILAACFTTMPELLGMTAHRAVLARLNIVTIIILLVSLVALVPWDASRGAAMAVALTVTLNGLLVTYQVRRLMHIDPHRQLWRLIKQRLFKNSTASSKTDTHDSDSP